MENIILGFTNVMQFQNLFLIVIGSAIGLFAGAMPGLSATMTVALLLPLTFVLKPAAGLSMLASIYMAAMYGGSISAILLRTPGTPAAAATVLDGYPLARDGKAGKALGISLFASFIGGLMSCIALLTLAPFLGYVALEFGPIELFSVAVLGLTIIGSLSRGSTTLGLISGVIGVLLAMVGMDPITGVARFTFGNIYLFSGIPFVVALIGLFSIPQAIRLVESTKISERLSSSISDRIIPTFKEMKKVLVTSLRGGIIGIVVGIIPGAGGDTASWFSYNEAKRFSKNPDNFGKGEIVGVAAAESSNNAVVGGALIPTLALGIPGSSTTAVLLGGLMVHGIMPGPTLLTEYADVTYTLIWALLISTFVMVGLGLLFTKVSVQVTKVKDHVMAPIIVVLCVIGSFSISNSMFDVFLMFGFGILGYAMDKIKMPTAPMVIGLILGGMLNNSMHQSLIIGDGSWTIFLKSPISLIVLIIAFLSILQNTAFFKLLFFPLIKIVKNIKNKVKE